MGSQARQSEAGSLGPDRSPSGLSLAYSNTIDTMAVPVSYDIITAWQKYRS